jgi:hypothetical protein
MFPYYQLFLLARNGSQIKAKFTIEQTKKAQRGSRGIALLFL